MKKKHIKEARATLIKFDKVARNNIEAGLELFENGEVISHEQALYEINELIVSLESVNGTGLDH